MPTLQTAQLNTVQEVSGPLRATIEDSVGIPKLRTFN
jgi:hypothetical protein